MTGLEVSVLGPLRARRDGTDVALGGRRQQAVLARLALAGGRTVAVDRLVDELWDGSPPPTAVPTLQSYISNLRRLLGGDPSPIERDGDGYRLRADRVTLVTTRFEELVAAAVPSAPAPRRLAGFEEALGLWHGAALGELADEPWAQGDAVRLTELRLAAEEGRFQALLDLGRASLVTGELDALVRAHPLRERFTALLVLALYRAGRQAEALRAYERQRSHLADELGLDPSPELARLAAQVLEQDAALDLVPSDGAEAASPEPAASGSASPFASPSGAALAGSASPGGASPPSTAGLPDLASLVLPLPPAVDERRARSRFVGRTTELTALRDAWDATVAGERHLALLAGEPGAGKTRLAQQVARWAHEHGGNVWWGRCTAENLLAFQPVVEAFRTASRVLPREHAAALARERPPIAALLPDVAGLERQTERAERWELFEAMVDLVEEGTSERPLLLVVDDLQWADASTVLLLDHLVRQGRASRLLVVATARRPAGRPTPEVDQLVADLRRDDRLVEVAVEGMDTDEVVSLLGERGVTLDHEQADALRARTAGNPFFLEALVEHGSADVGATDVRSVPTTVRDLLDDRLRALGDDALQVLSAAAVIGPRIDLAVLGAVVDLEPDALLDVIDEAVAASLLVEDEDLGWVSFPHALVRSALVARTTRNREAHLHLRIAEVVDARPQHLDREATVAGHLLAAGRLAPPVRTADAAVAAGRRALTGLADDDARSWAQRALDALALAPDGDPEVGAAEVRALVLLAETERLLGAVDRDDPAYLRALAAARGPALDPPTLSALANEAAVMSVGHTYPWGLSTTAPDVVALLEQVLDRPRSEEMAVRPTVLGHAAMALTAGPEHARSVAWASEALATIDAVGDDPTARCTVVLNWRQVMAVPDTLDERVLRVGEVADLDGVRDFGLYISAQGFASTQLLEAGRFAEAAEHRELHRRRIQEREGPYYTAYIHFLDGLHAFLEGRVDEADALDAEGSRVGEPNQVGPGSQWDIGRRCMTARARGREADLADLADLLVGTRPDLLAGWALRARVLLATGDVADAVAVLADLDRDALAAAGDDLLGYLVVDLLAEAAWLLGDASLGHAVAEVAAPWSGRVGVIGQGAVATGPLDRAIGLALGAAGDLAGAEAALCRAVEVGEAQGWVPTAARAGAERAEVRLQRGVDGAADEVARAGAFAADHDVPLLGPLGG